MLFDSSSLVSTPRLRRVNGTLILVRSRTAGDCKPRRAGLAGNQGVDNGCPVDLQTNGVLGQLDPLKDHPQKPLFVGWAANAHSFDELDRLARGPVRGNERFPIAESNRRAGPCCSKGDAADLQQVPQSAVPEPASRPRSSCRPDEAVRHVVAVALAILGGIGRT